MKMTNCTFEDLVEIMDGKTYEDCKFKNVTLIYMGGPPPTLARCAFEDSEFKFDGPAANTLAFLRSMMQPTSGLRNLFLSTFGMPIEPEGDHVGTA